MEGSYEKVNIAFFVNNYTEPRAKMTLSKETLPYLYEGVAHLHKIGFSPVADLAAAANYWDDEDFAIFERESIEKMADAYWAGIGQITTETTDIDSKKRIQRTCDVLYEYLIEGILEEVK